MIATRWTISQAQWEQAHTGHFGVEKTFLHLRRMGLCPTRRWVAKRVQSCWACQLFHRMEPSCPFGEWNEATKPGEVIDMDFMGPFLERKVGKKLFVLVIIDRLTGLDGAWAVKGAGGKEVIRGLERWVSCRGVPKILCFDVSQAAQSKEVQQWCAKYVV